MKRIIAISLTLLMTISTLGTAYGGNVPYEGYIYDYWGEAVPAPAAYVPSESLSGQDLGAGGFNQPSDMFVSEDSIYIVDTGNNRIVVFDKDWNLLETIESFENNGKADSFMGPTGIFVSADEHIYVADKANGRVIVLDGNRRAIFELKNPSSESFDPNFQFIPKKVGVDYAGRIYVVAEGVFEGVMSFDDQGEFFGYQGTIKVSVSPADIIWRALSTKAQREKQVLFIPTEFTNMDVDPNGFVYTTNVDMNSDENIKRLNPGGKDVLRRPENKKVDGDVFYLPPQVKYGGPSRFMDIEVRSDGIYSVLDTARGRIFTYNHEGDLMYIFGTLGTQIGSFKKAVAIESTEDELLVLDQERGEIVVFEPIRYGQLIDDAMKLRYQGKEKDSVELWFEVLKLNANYELAYVGIGKSLLSKGNNKEAMKYFKLGMDQKYYSIAFKRYRNEVLKDNLGMLLTISLLLLTGSLFYRYRKKKSKGKDGRNYEG